jgi:DNA-binding response OmpR family regulator
VKRILVAEDEIDLAFGLQVNLEVEGYSVTVVYNGEDALVAASEVRFDLVILDLMLPAVGGFDVLTRLRQSGRDMPVLILSARGEEVDRVRAFRAGADDYVTKPFGVMELMLRVRAILRRGSAPPIVTPAGRMLRRIGTIEVDLEDRTVLRRGGEVALTPKALDLLLALLGREGRVATRQELLRTVWGYSHTVTTRTVDAHVAELRRKLEDDPSNPQIIVTVWKVGYRLRA